MNRTKQRILRMAMQIILFRRKVKTLLNKGLLPKLKLNCKLENGQIFLLCIVCNEFKERTPEYFSPCIQAKYMLTCDAGQKVLNSTCRKCLSIHGKYMHDSGEGFIYRLTSAYWKDGFRPKEFKQKLINQNGRGLITGVMLKLEGGENVVGIHRFSNKEDHFPDNVFLECQELNVSQHHAISSLFEAWKELYYHLITNFSNQYVEDNTELNNVRTQYNTTPKQSGITTGIEHDKNKYRKMCREQHFPSILRQAIGDHIRNDIKTSRFVLPANVSIKSFAKVVFEKSIKKFELQRGRCAYSNVSLTIKNCWQRISFERVDNNLPHFTFDGELTNIVFVCRLFNGSRKQMSTEKILTYFLHQKLVPVPDSVRLQAQKKLDNFQSLEHVHHNKKQRIV